MISHNIDIDFLISAFAYPYSSLNETFYLRKKDFKIIGVHAFDYFLVSDCKGEYDSGVTRDQEINIKEAIIASEKGYNTHIIIPRLLKEERIQMMKEFVYSAKKYEKKLNINLNNLMLCSDDYSNECYKKGIKHGLEMEYLTYKIRNKNIKLEWTSFYREKTKIIAKKWLNEQIESI